MHPILADRRRLAIYLLAWLVIGLLLTFGLRRDASWLTAAALFLPVSVLYAFVTLSSGYVCRAFPIDAHASAWRVAGVQAVAASLASGAGVAAAEGWAAGVDSLGSHIGAPAPLAGQRHPVVVRGALLFCLAAALHYLLIASEASQEAATQALELRLLAREAELKALRAQIDPHFIFNSLHSISALTSIDAAAARRMCLLLADFL